MDESYCALCGVCFGVYAELYHNRVQVEDVAWTEYFLACEYIIISEGKEVTESGISATPTRES